MELVNQGPTLCKIYPGRGGWAPYVRGIRLHSFDCCTGAAALTSWFRVYAAFRAQACLGFRALDSPET